MQQMRRARQVNLACWTDHARWSGGVGHTAIDRCLGGVVVVVVVVVVVENGERRVGRQRGGIHMLFLQFKTFREKECSRN